MQTLIQKFMYVFLSIFVMGSLYAQQPFIYPSQGQSKEQQEKDEFECHRWAKEQSGFDPMNPPSQQELEARAQQQQGQQQQQQAASGRTAGGVARGAVRGAVVGEIVADEPGAGAAVGAVSGGIRSNRRAQMQQQQQAQRQQQAVQQQAQAELQKLRDGYNRAFSACLTGRGYTVK